MALFTLADLHLSFSTEKPMDIFGKNWDRHFERIEENWNSLVSNDDTVVVPGDISWGMNLDEAKPDFEFIDRLNGKKIIMKGNHDYWWQSMKKLQEFAKENSFDTISFLHNTAMICENFIICGSRGWFCEASPSPDDRKIIAREAIRFDISISEAKKLDPDGEREIIAFSHYPVINLGEESSPILEVLVKHGIKRLYYGHLHSVNPSILIKKAGGVELELVSADYRQFTPLRIE